MAGKDIKSNDFYGIMGQEPNASSAQYMSCPASRTVEIVGV